jgi:putative transposase
LEILNDTCNRNQFHLLESETEEDWLRLLLSLRPSHSPAKAVQTIKTNLSRWMFDAFSEMESELGKRSLWSRGYYLRGIGDVTNETVLQYVASQRAHHEVELGNSRELGFFRHSDPRPFLELRQFSHCVAEYNCHLVCCPLRHQPIFEEGLVDDFLSYTHRVLDSKRIELISASMLEDHLHLFAALRPDQSPEFFAFAVMNNTAQWMEKRNPGAMKLWDAPGLWTPSAFIRTAGIVTTDTVRAYLKTSREVEADS